MKEIPTHNLAIVVMVVNKKGEFLLVKNYARGWEFPGGYVESGESIKDAAIREVKEESGIDIRVTHLLGIEQDLENSKCVVIVKAESKNGKFALSDENQGADYFTFDDALKHIHLKSFKERLIRCVRAEGNPFLIE